MSEAEKPQPFASQLATGRQRYLAQAMEYTLAEGWSSAEDFLTHFPPRVIIESLAEVDDLRVEVLVKVGKVHEKLAAKKSIESASEDLEIALTEGLAEPSELLAIYGPDDRVSFLESTGLWAFSTEGDFWKLGSNDREYERALARIVFLIERALAEKLLDIGDVFDALTFDEISTALPLTRLQEVARHALVTGREGRALDEASLLEVVPLDELLGCFELAEVWTRIVVQRIAGPQGLVGEGEAGEAPARIAVSAPKPARQSVRPPASAKAAPVKAPVSTAKPAPVSVAKPSTPRQEAVRPAPAAPPASPPPPPPKTSPPPPVVPPPAAVPAEAAGGDDARAGVVERLRGLNRLPPSHPTLPLPILLSIDSMYADLDIADDDDEREQVIREAFPNQLHLRQAMLALIELLDPSINTKDALIRDADVNSLIKIVMFEERRRR